MCAYHMRRGELDTDDRKQISRAVKCAAGGDFPRRMPSFLSGPKSTAPSSTSMTCKDTSGNAPRNYRDNALTAWVRTGTFRFDENQSGEEL